MRYLDWKLGGVLLGLTFFFAILLTKPIGVSTQFSVTSGIAMDIVDSSTVYESPDRESGYGSKYEYLDRNDGKLAKDVANPVNYGMVFVFFVAMGGLLATLTNRKVKPTANEKQMPSIYRERISKKPMHRYVVVFISGVISLFAARLAGGCTSGHMMSGMMQSALSGFVFAAAVFATAIPTAMIMYRKK